MGLTDTKGQISFKNLRITYGNTNLVGTVEEQIRRLNVSDERRGLFGADLMMLAEGDIWVSDSIVQNKDFLIVSGLLNYAQAITHRLMTPRGQHPADPSFGVPWYNYLGLGYGNKVLVEGQLMADIAEEIIRDRRTSSVPRISSVFQDINTIAVECTVIPVSSSTGMNIAFMAAGS